MVASAIAAQGETFRIIARIDPTMTADIDLARLYAFEQNVSLRVRTDPRFVPNERVIEMVESIGMVDGVGLSITRGYDIDVEHDLVVAWSGGSAEITAVQETPQGLVVAGLFKDHEGHITVPPQGSLAAYTTAGQRLCFTSKRIVVEPDILPMSFAVLVDRSGSVSSEMDRIKSAARAFIDALPDSANCSVGSFAKDWSLSHQTDGDQTCEPDNFDIESWVAAGSTNIFGPLRDAYDWLNDPARIDHQKAVILLTDGRANLDADSEAATLLAKRGVFTFVYYMGKSDDRWLKGLADSFFADTGGAVPNLERYFNVVSEVYAEQTVLELTPCPEDQP
ncbi:hypothetical protein RGUI_3186 [Rhodovulum sp. P5]|nr:hypothetical protein RGUI_3186 [Rhodovulum sp. P5]